MARARRTGWRTAVVASLLASLLPACSPFWASIHKERPPAAGRGAAVGEPDGGKSLLLDESRVSQDPGGSPYHVLPPPQLSDPSPGDRDVRQAVYPPPAEGAGPDGGPKPAPKTGKAPAPEVMNLAEKPAPEPPLVAALRCFLEQKPAEAVDVLRRFDKPNQELLLCLLPLAVQLSRQSVSQARPQEVTALVEELRGIEKALKPRAELVIDKLSFCERIEGFGRFRPLPETHAFLAPGPGRPGELVQLYVELRNLSSIPRDTVFESRLASTVEILTPDGRERAYYSSFHDGNRPILTRTPLEDFCNPYSFYVPSGLPPGTYRLIIRVTDVPTGRTAQRSLPFHVTTLPVVTNR